MKITEEERQAVYKTIMSRRFVSGEFKSDLIPDEVLTRLLTAAHHAPSVGFMQPWDFIIIKDPAVKQKVKDAFEVANAEGAEMFQGERKEKYKSLKLEGIMEAPLNICVTCDRNRTGSSVLGRTANPEMDLYSTVCAVQNIWLAARAENLGMGWVSIIHDDALRAVLAIPEDIIPIAYLYLGYVDVFPEKPELEEKGWLSRLDMETLIHYDRWTPKPD